VSERKYFGTDGVRGSVADFLTPDLVFKLGAASAAWIDKENPRVLVIRDTRESGPVLEEALASGIATAGGEAVLAGVLPTPAAGILCESGEYDLAVVVSASHNIYSDNGIKFILPSGSKLDDQEEAQIEATLDEDHSTGQPGSVITLDDGAQKYVAALAGKFDLDLQGLPVALDCGNGATYEVAPEIFSRLGADVKLIGADPDGKNINAECGSTCPEVLAKFVVDSGAAIGFAFDGDGDRVIAIDGSGEIRDGDELLTLVALDLGKRDGLGGGVVVTTMTNYGFHSKMEEEGIAVKETQVGDRYVQQGMAELGWKFGGEQSGHLIWSDFARTGDGIAGALLTLQALGDSKLEDFYAFDRLPQKLVNVKIRDRSEIAGATRFQAAVEKESAGLEGRGRVVVRPSGTEPLLRIMVEAPGVEECESVVEGLAAIAEDELGT